MQLGSCMSAILCLGTLYNVNREAGLLAKTFSLSSCDFWPLVTVSTTLLGPDARPCDMAIEGYPVAGQLLVTANVDGLGDLQCGPVVANLRTRVTNVSLVPDLGALGLQAPKARNTLTDQALPLEDGKLAVRLRPSSFALVWVE